MKTPFLYLLAILSLQLATFSLKAQTVTDYDGHVYTTVEIGTQTWMAENLRSEHFANGSLIVGTWIYDDDSANLEVYGRLYNWDAAMHYTTEPGTQGICPDGWHLPTDAEWTLLGNFLGGNAIAGGKMKATGTDHWSAPNTGATNESGFSALGAGEIENNHFQFLHTAAVFWSSTQASASRAKYRYLTHDDAALHPMTWEKSLGYSVRCVQDAPTSSHNQIDQFPTVKIYPNPARYSVIVEMVAAGAPLTSLEQVVVYSGDGQCLYAGTMTSGKSTLFVDAFPPGWYLVKVGANPPGRLIIE